MEQPIESISISQYHLTIRFCTEGFDLRVCNELNVLLSFKKVSVSLFSLSVIEIVGLLKHELLLNYQSIKLICESNQYTFVPEPFFTQESAADFLHFQFKPSKTDQISINRIPKLNTVNVFSMPKTLYDALKEVFPDKVIDHHMTYFLSEKVKLQGRNSVNISIRSTIMDVVVIIEGGLQLINSYSFNTPEDFTYYTLNLFDKLSLDTENCSVILFDADKKPELQKTLELYLEVTKGE